MENYITLSHLNDFVFCPRSIYFHQLYSKYNEHNYKQQPQIAGTEAHNTIDAKNYSTSKEILQGIEVFSSKYNIAGKIDIFNIKNGRLTERKRSIKTIYDGYIYQVYAQYFALKESGFHVAEIVIHDLVHNKNYFIDLPEQNREMFSKFENTIYELNNYNIHDSNFIPNIEKCSQCIYSTLCDKSLC